MGPDVVPHITFVDQSTTDLTRPHVLSRLSELESPLDNMK